MTRLAASADDVRQIPEQVWRDVLRSCSRFLLHHPMCGVMLARDCTCLPLCVGALFLDPGDERVALA